MEGPDKNHSEHYPEHVDELTDKLWLPKEDLISPIDIDNPLEMAHELQAVIFEKDHPNEKDEMAKFAIYALTTAWREQYGRQLRLASGVSGPKSPMELDEEVIYDSVVGECRGFSALTGDYGWGENTYLALAVAKSYRSKGEFGAGYVELFYKMPIIKQPEIEFLEAS